MYAPAFIIADTNSVYRYGMANLLKEHFRNCTVTEVTDANALMATLQHSLTNVILMHVSLPPVNGFEAAHLLMKHDADCRIMLYAHERSNHIAVQAFAAGAVAFFYSDEDADTIVYKTGEVLHKGCCITTNEFIAYKAAHTRLTNPQQRSKALSLREKEVLQLIQQGITSKEIAARLNRSVKTIKNHRNNIMSKTGRHNIAQLISYVQETGCLREEESKKRE